MTEPRIAVVGATGAVGPVVLELLAERGFAQVRAFASGRSAGSRVGYGEGELEIEEATPDALAAGDLDLCFFSVGTGPSRKLVPAAVEGGAVCIDKSSAFRLADGVPLVVPEVNGDRRHGSRGDRGEPELLDDPADVRPRSSPRGRRPTSCARRYLSICVRRWNRPDGGASLEGSRGGERRHGLAARRRRVRGGVETARGEPKILDLPDLPFSATCARVPVLVGHSQAVWVETEAAAFARPGARDPFRRAFGERERAPDRPRSRRAGRGARRANPPGHRRRRACDVGRLRQPPQGSSAERDPDRRAAPRAAGAGSVGSGRAAGNGPRYDVHARLIIGLVLAGIVAAIVIYPVAGGGGGGGDGGGY